MSDRFNTPTRLPNALFLGLFGSAVLSSASCTLSVLDHLGAESPPHDAGVDEGPPADVDSGPGDMDSGSEPPPDAGHDTDEADADAGPMDAGVEKPDADTCHPVVPTDHKRVFVTSELFAGPLMSLEHMDAECERLADESCLGGTWRVWLSDKTRTPFTRLNHSPAPYERLDGKQVASKWSDLVDGLLENSISIDEQGEPATGIVWTGSTAAGNGFASLTCNGWQASDSSFAAKTGICTATGMEWTHQVDTSCGNQARVYCFEQ
jgi:hypothetical protein